MDLFPQTPHCEMLILFERVEHPNGTAALEHGDPAAQLPPGPPDGSPEALGTTEPTLLEQDAS